MWWATTRRVSARLFLPPHLARDPVAQERATLALATLIVLVPAGFVRGLQLLERGPRAQGFVLVAAAVLAMQLPWILRFTGSYVTVANLGVAILGGVLTSAIYFSGGVSSFALLTLPFVALVATFLLGRRGGGIWSGLALAEVLAWASIEYAGASPPNRFPEATRLQSAATASFAMIVLVYAVGRLTLRTRDEADAVPAPTNTREAETPKKADEPMVARAVGDLTRRADAPLFELAGQLAAARDVLANRSDAGDDAVASLRDAERAAVELREILSDLRLVDQLMRREAPAPTVSLRATLARALDVVAACDARSWSLRIGDTPVPELATDERAVLRLLTASLRALGDRSRDPSRVRIEGRFEHVARGALVLSLELAVSDRSSEPTFPDWLLEAALAQALFVMRDGRGMLMLSFARPVEIAAEPRLITA